MDKRAIILVHGVGPAETGSTIKSLLSGDKNRQEECSLSTFQLGQHSYTRGELADGLTLFESNWSELRPLQSSGPWILFEALVLVFSMLKVSSLREYADDSGSHTLLGKAYFRAFVWGLFWCIHPPIVMMFLVSGNTFAAVTWVLLLSGVSWLLGRYDKAFFSGLLWCGGLFLVIGLYWWKFLTAAQLVQWASLAYLGVQLVTVLIGYVAMIGVVWSTQDRSSLRLRVRLAFIYVPFLIASSIGSLVWVLALVPVTSGGTDIEGGFSVWAALYGKSLPFDLYAAERFNGLVAIACGLLLLLPAVWLIVLTKLRDEDAAVRARSVLGDCLLVIPVILVFASFGFYWLILFGTSNDANNAENIWSAYATWSTRVLAVLPFLFGGLAFVLKAAGDVLLYLAPQTDLIRTRKVAVDRLASLALHLKADGYEVLLLCHSQGTIIGLDVVLQFPGKFGVWLCGSPADALYYDLLGLERVGAAKVKEFRNYYRFDDPIAGAVRTPVSDWYGNVEAGWGGHTNYWPIFDIKQMRAVLDRMAKGSSSDDVVQC
ncbi:hypothetical protein [Yoonia sp. SDW83-1]|uniref:hypothetical protein n=1 Tax=Yoonia sp. SDW83-1 TaxID=3366945 RepID=UPI00398C3D75